MARFLRVEAAGGLLLLAATLVALVWANSPWSAGYRDLWRTTLTFEGGPFHLTESLGLWVNDGLMTLFFFVVGLEIKRELVHGELANRRHAALPALAALGGMVVPATIFIALNAGTSGARGWGIPMATDIAFALGILALLGSRVPGSVGVLLLGLAIADDIGAILVIAAFYTERISVSWLLAAVAGLVVVVAMQRLRVENVAAYALVGALVWACTLESGVHATIAGVALGLLTPARPWRAEQEPVSIAERLETALHPWTSYVVVPVFALANAGIPLSTAALRDAASSRVTVGVVLGLVAGKAIGITLFAWLAVRLRLAHLPESLRWGHVVGMGALAGVGFTVSIFVTGLAYDGVRVQDEAKIGVLVASVLAALLGTAVLARATRRHPSTTV
ncbi:MAG: Na+/H+ antiporter NhaA [Microthrixaceae bacterium]